MKKYELKPGRFDSCKSFYRKAYVLEREDGTKILLSYNTIVASIHPDGTILRHWGGYSATTMRHINSFIRGLSGGGKKWWMEQAVTPVPEAT